MNTSIEQSWNKPFNINVNIEFLKKTNDPIIIYALVDEAEAIANACKENGILVAAFCDNESRKTKKPYWNLEVIFTPDLPKRFPKAIMWKSRILLEFACNRRAKETINMRRLGKV
jgi:hypothetical protein